MAAAEHGATFPLAEKLRATMTPAQLHDFAMGPVAKPSPKRVPHPALAQRAAAVKTAHAHLTKTVPGFRQKSGAEQLRHTQRHVTRHSKSGGY